MRTSLLSSAASAWIVLASVAPAGAQCAFDIAPAKGFRASMVRAYLPCPTYEHPTGNAETEAGTTACQPVHPYYPSEDTAASDYTYSAKGGCTVETKVKAVGDCAAVTNADGTSLNLPAGPCHVTYIRSRCRGIMKPSDLPVDWSDDGWTLTIAMRMSIDDADGDMTMVDVPMTFAFSTPNEGEFVVESSTAQFLAATFGPAAAALPSCTSMEITNVLIRDPYGFQFARVGTATGG
jgi:hypothetical protein